MKAYKITAFKNPKVDADYDAYCLPFKGKDIFGAHMMGINDFDYPDMIYFQADFLSIPFYDFVSIDLTFHVMSKNMLEILTSIKGFKYTTIPVTMIDDSFLGNPFEKEGKLKPEVPINTNYGAIQLKEFSNVFDYQSSIYKADLVFPEEIGQIEKLVLKNPNFGFLPLFKIKEAPQHLFVSDEAKIELERKKIQGCLFEEVEVS